MANTINTPVSSKQRVEKRGAAQTRPGLRPQRHSPHLSLFAHCVVATLSAASLTQPHKKSLSCKKREEKRDYDTWCSQVVSNPSTNQARTGLTSLIRREVVLSSWYGRNSFSASDLWTSGSEAADSVPATQSPKREVGTVALWPQARAC